MHSPPQVQSEQNVTKGSPNPSITTLFAFLLPIALTLYLYRRSLRIFFLRDDFAWLGLRLSIFSPADLFPALFAPMAQGTIRTLSERLFFLVFETLFGVEPLPMRLFAFLTLAASQALVVLIVHRLSGSWVAGSLAALCYGVNFGVVVAMCWLSSYNQILLGTLLLAAFYAFLRYAEAGSPRWLAACAVAYLLGFGALENVIVFPGILAAYCLLVRPTADHPRLPNAKLWRVVGVFLVPALLLAYAHLKLIPKDSRLVAYQMYFDQSIFASLAVYWQWLLGAAKLTDLVPDFAYLQQPTIWILSIATAATALWAALRRNWLPCFFLLFSLALISPMLPLRDHRTDYYLGSASLGFAMFLGCLPVFWKGFVGRTGYWLGFVICLAYLYPSWLVQQATFTWYLNTSSPVRQLIRAVEQASRLHPSKLILLSNVPDEVYWNAMDDEGFRLVGAERVRLAPGEGPAQAKYRIAPAAARIAFTKEAALVYSFDGERLKDVTRAWERGPALSLATGLSPFVSASEPAFADQFGQGWYPPADGQRWMGRQALVRLGGPFENGSVLQVEGYCPPALSSAAGAALRVEVSLNGVVQSLLPISAGELNLSVPIPPAMWASDTLEVQLRVSHSIRPPADGRELSLVFGALRVRPPPRK